MTDAADTFAQGVENITSALLVLLGRYEDLCRSTQRVVRTLVLLSVMMITLLVGLTYMIIRLEGLVDAARVDREHMREMTGQLGLVKESQYQLTRTRPEIGVVQAKDGSTVVRIRPSSESTAEVDIPVVLEPQSSARP